MPNLDMKKIVEPNYAALRAAFKEELAGACLAAVQDEGDAAEITLRALNSILMIALAVDSANAITELQDVLTAAVGALQSGRL